MFKSKFSKIILFFVVLSLAVPLVITAQIINPQPFWLKSDPGNTNGLKGKSDNTVRFIKNNSGNVSYFVPNNSSVEWEAFKIHKPADLEMISECSASTICGESCFVFEPPTNPEANDYKSIIYETVQIGTGAGAQCWFASNLKTRYNYNYTAITQWPYNATPSYQNRFACMGTSNNCSDQELFYQPLAVLSATNYLPASDFVTSGKQGICPSGWRLPSQGDIETFKTLHNCFNEVPQFFDTNCLNNLGLNINLYGYRNLGITVGSGTSAYFLLTNRSLSGNKYVYPLMKVNQDGTSAENSNEAKGFSIRCIKNISGAAVK